MIKFTFSKLFFSLLLILSAFYEAIAQEAEQDAKLKLYVALDSVMCPNESKKLTIDTTGTGAFKNGTPSLTVTAISEDGTTSEIKEMKESGNGILEIEVSPLHTTSYNVSFSYMDQKLEKSITLHVWNFNVTTEDQVICEGEEVTLKAKVSPEGSRIKWYDADQTTLLGEGEVTVAPTFDYSVTGSKSTHKYYAVPYSDLVYCNAPMDTLDVIVYQPLVGMINDMEICEGQSARLDAGSYQAATYMWTINGETTLGSRYYTDSPKQTTTYHVYMTRGEVCVAEDEATVIVHPSPVVLSIDSVYFRIVDVKMDNVNENKYRFSVDEGDWTEDSHLTELRYGTHTLKIEDENGCTTDTTFTVNPPTLPFGEDDSVESISANANNSIVNVYTISGAAVKTNVKKSEALVGLKPEIYVVGKEKVEVKE